MRWLKRVQQATQQGAAPDRLQLRSSFLLATLPAAGELGRCAAARGFTAIDTIYRVSDTLIYDRLQRESKIKKLTVRV